MQFPPEVRPVIDELLPLCRALGEGACAVSIGGSYGKGTFDKISDLDFRLFCERRLAPKEAYQEAHARLQAAIDRWAAHGVTIDGCWVRTVQEIDAQVDAWLSGTLPRVDLVWTIWGYHVLTDVYNQMIIDDPDGIIARWHSRLSPYPPQLKQAILDKHLKSVRYWRNDYHYQHKVERGDVVFLASLTARLVHDLIQILFALNETYYAGDGNNLVFVEHFEHVPVGFVERVHTVLYPGTGDGALEEQYRQVCALIDETVALVQDLGQA